MTEHLRIGLVGAGAMGANHARVVGTSPTAHLEVVVAPDLARASRLATDTGAKAASQVAAAYGCDAVIVASPTDAHASIAMELIGQGIPVLVEKPLTADLAAAQKIVDAAADQDVPLMCGFVERFNAAVTTAAKLLGETPDDEPPVHVLSIRHSPPAARITTSVVYDLLIHDIDLTIGLLPGIEVQAVTGRTLSLGETGTADVADCTLQFASGSVATLSASRASQRKLRTLLVTTPTTLVDIDLLRQDVTVYRHVRQSIVGDSPAYRAETIVDIPFVRHQGEPLALQFDHFTRLVRGEADLAAERATLMAPHRVATQLHEGSTAAALPLVGAGP
jgi:predicted dehydrogenase